MRLRSILKPLDYLLVTVIGAFIGLELADHYTHYRTGTTLSDWIWKFEKRFGAPARVLIGAAVTVLFTHLVFHRP